MENGQAAAGEFSVNSITGRTRSGGRLPAAVTWRLRVQMDDRPGTLARIAIRLADLGCNVLGLSVIPIPGGVLDEIVVRPPEGLSPSELVAALQGEGCDCSPVAPASVRDLVDSATATLSSATRAVTEPARWAEVVRDVLSADMVTVVPLSEANPARTEGGHRAVVLTGATAVVLRRQWSPFTDVELARIDHLLALLAAAKANVSAPAAVICDDGSAVVLRSGRPGDADAVSALHARCSMETLHHRYHTGSRTVPRRWLHRLLVPPRGISVLGVCGQDVVALGQLIPSDAAGVAELSLLVEDTWQNKGLGTALVSRLNAIAATQGFTSLFAMCLPSEDRIHRAALRLGLETSVEIQGHQKRVTISTDVAFAAPDRQDHPARLG